MAVTCTLGKATPQKVDAYIPPKQDVAHIKQVSHSQPTVKAATKVQEATPPKPAPQPQAEKPVAPPQPVLSGKDAWLSASNISASDYGYADYIISHESNWNPNATEPTFGAHGLPQALPYSKTGCGWIDAVCQLNWADDYAKSRYGSWYAAYIHWQNAHNW